MGGRLLLAADVYYKLWDNAPLWEDVFVNQWAFAVGAQLTHGKLKYRLGYSYNTDPINHSVGGNLDGFPVGQDAVQLFQASSTAAISQHRITAGIGRQGFLIPNYGSGPVRRSARQRSRGLRGLANLVGHVLRRHGAHLAVWRLFQAARVTRRTADFHAPSPSRACMAEGTHTPPTLPEVLGILVAGCPGVAVPGNFQVSIVECSVSERAVGSPRFRRLRQASHLRSRLTPWRSVRYGIHI